MIWFLFVIALFYVMFGTLMLFATALTKEQSSSQPTFIIVLGLLAVMKGLLFLFGPQEKVKRMIEWWLEGSDQKFKVWAVVAIGLGIAILVTIVQ